MVCIFKLAIFPLFFVMFCFFKQKTAYEMRISDWSQTCALPISLGGGGPIVRVDSPYRHSGFAFSSERIHRASQKRQLIHYFQRTIKPLKSRNTTLNPYINTRARLWITLGRPA